MNEKKLQSQFLKWLDDRFIYYVKTIVCSRAGVPDCIACINGYFVAFEFKGDGGKLSPLQKFNGLRIEENKGSFIVVTPDNYCEITEKLIQGGA